MLSRFCFMAFLLLAAVDARPGEVLDRLTATVNGHALLQSDVDEELRYEFFAAKRPLSDASAEDRTSALDRLIDQELLREQMRSAEFKPVSGDEILRALETFKSEYGAGSSWQEALETYQMSEPVVANHITTELNQLRLIDLRLRPSIQIDSESIQSYYTHQLLPKLSAGQHPTLQESAATIRELLVQQKMNESLESWLEALRSQAKIQRFPNAGGPQQK